MIHAMTEAKTVDTATLAGRTMLIKPLDPLQQAHLLRYVTIFTNGNVDMMEKAEAVSRFLAIVHSSIPDPEDVKFLIKAEEEGRVTMENLLGELNGTNGAAPKPAVKRVGRPRKSTQ